MSPGFTKWLLILIAAGTLLVSTDLPTDARELMVCVSDFSNKTRFSSFDPLPDNLAFYLIGSPNIKVIERWRVRGEVDPSAGLTAMFEMARKLGADILVEGTVTEEAGKLVAAVRAYNLSAKTGDGYRITIVDPENCRAAASKAAAVLQQHIYDEFGRRVTVESLPLIVPEATNPVVSEKAFIGSIEPTEVTLERQALAKRSLRSAAVKRAKAQASILSKDVVTEGDFGKITARLARYFSMSYDSVFSVGDPTNPVSKADVVTALSKGLGKAEHIGGADASSGPVSRQELAELLSAYLPAADGLPEGYKEGKTSGLVIDVRGLGFERSMSPIIESEDGTVVYPDKKKLPSYDYVVENGIASFVHDLMKAPRIGAHPLIVRAIGVKGTASQIAVINDADAAAILALEAKDSLFKECKVTFLLDPGY